MNQTTDPGVVLNDQNVNDARHAQASKLFQTGVMLIYGKRKSVDKAIKCIQKAIIFNDSDYKYWQFLGEAYYQRGSLNPAINCFIKSLKLAEDNSNQDNVDEKRKQADCIYSRLRMSDIRLSVGHRDEAAVGYIDIIANDPDNVAALIGLSKTELQLSRTSFSSGLVKLGHLHCMNALKYALRAIKLRPHLCLTWKLASDCCLIQFIFGQRGKFETKLDEKFPKQDNEAEADIVVDRRTCIQLAQQFLCKALDIEPFQDSGCLWHNLGISLYLMSTITEKQLEREKLLKKSLKCLLKALDVDRNNSQVKNSIGVVAFNLNLLNSAQNFIIKSIQSNMSTSEVQFSNLGYIYLQKGEYRLADVAFNRCQAEEPLYSRSWLGNAILNEQRNVENLSQLRHCQRLENNYESQLMYATKVTSLPCLEEYKKDLLNALDGMIRVINYNEYSLEANNTLGLLYERCSFDDLAVSCFEQAYKISPQDSRIIFNRLRHYNTMASCYCSDRESTLDSELIKTAEKMANSGNREYILNFIYYLFNNGDYKGVNSKMNKFLDKLPQGDVRNKISAQILLGLAAKADSGDFKSWLFKNVIDSENILSIEVVINLNCLMLLGAIMDDTSLVEQISRDLSKHLLGYISTRSTQFVDLFYSVEGYWIRFTIFCSIFCVPNKNGLIKSLVALFPTIAELWLYLGLTLMFERSKQQAAVFCIKKANLIGSSCAELVVICDLLLSILTQVAKLKPGVLDSRKNYLSRAIYKYPNYDILWKSLTLSCSKDKAKKNSIACEENSALFQLAIDQVIKMIMVT